MLSARFLVLALSFTSYYPSFTDVAFCPGLSKDRQYIVQVNGLLKNYTAKMSTLLSDWFGAVLGIGPDPAATVLEGSLGEILH